MKNLFSILCLITFLFGKAQNVTSEINLWKDKAPNGPGPSGNNLISTKGSITNVSTPKLLVHLPKNPNGTAILVISGGGYAHIETGKESAPASNWLNSLGITAFELVYRLPQENWQNTEVAFQDAQRAMRVIRNKAKDLGINPNKIGVLGFSAGGHLAGMLSSTFGENYYKPTDSIDNLSAKPNFCALIYPIISMLPPNNNTHSFRMLLGKNPSLEQETKYSVEKQVNSENPTTFIAQALDDPISPVENSILMFQALKSKNIPAEMHIFQNGGHGWGMGKPGTDTTSWSGLFENWLKNKFQ